MIVSFSEPGGIRALGETSSTPELYGVDVLMVGGGGLVGVQRKRVDDLVASVFDGRLWEQLAKMGRLDVGVLLVEGRVRWSNDGGVMLNVRGGGLSRGALRALLWKVRFRGVYVEWTDGIEDTVDWLVWFEGLLGEGVDVGLRRGGLRRGGVSGVSGDEWLEWFLQGFPGIGPKTAKKLVDRFGCPVVWCVEQEELGQVVGPRKAAKLYQLLGGAG